MTQYIKSITPVSITCTGTPSAASSAFPAAVDTSKSIIIFNGLVTSTTSSTTHWNGIGRWTFDDSTHLRFTRDAAASNNVTAEATVVEFNSDVTSNQQGVITITAGTTSNTATITAVGGTAFVIWEGVETTAGSGGFTDSWGVALDLTNSTTVTANIGYTLGSNIKVGYRVIELSSNIISQVEKFAATSTSTATSFTYTLSGTFTTGRSLVFPNGATHGSSINATVNTAYRRTLTSASLVTLNRNGSGNATTKTIKGTVVEFTSGALNGSVQTGTIQGDGANASNTATLSPSVDTTMSWVQWTGFEGNSGQPNQNISHLILTNSTTLTGSTASSPWQTTSIMGWNAIQFDNTASGSSTIPIFMNQYRQRWN